LFRQNPVKGRAADCGGSKFRCSRGLLPRRSSSQKGLEYLLVERYDRKHVTIDGAPGVERLHQEDFCQAQNIVSEPKYQTEGGPSFRQCFILLRNVSTAPVIDLAIF
jgi:serine/threonine protein kinase HipA of HipAB toxin-antitoxin module